MFPTYQFYISWGPRSLTRIHKGPRHGPSLGSRLLSFLSHPTRDTKPEQVPVYMFVPVREQMSFDCLWLYNHALDLDYRRQGRRFESGVPLLLQDGVKAARSVCCW